MRRKNAARELSQAALRLARVIAQTTEEVRRVLGVRLWSRGLDELVASSMAAVDAGELSRPLVFACANPHSLVVADQDEEFKRALGAADAVVADGVGLTMVARTLYGIPDLPRITGSDYFAAVMRALDERSGRAAFLGSRPEVLRLLEKRCHESFPRTKMVAMISPPFGNWSDELNSSYLRTLREARADVLWVGMTAPKQEKWIQSNRERIHAPVVGAIGAVFDYFAGTIRRAPPWVCRAGFEWAYRLAHEPSRLWQRNIVSAPRFINLALRDRMSTRRGSGVRAHT